MSLNLYLMKFKSFLKNPPNDKYIYFPLQMTGEAMLDVWAPLYQDQYFFNKAAFKIYSYKI